MPWSLFDRTCGQMLLHCPTGDGCRTIIIRISNECNKARPSITCKVVQQARCDSASSRIRPNLREPERPLLLQRHRLHIPRLHIHRRIVHYIQLVPLPVHGARAQGERHGEDVARGLAGGGCVRRFVGVVALGGLQSGGDAVVVKEGCGYFAVWGDEVGGHALGVYQVRELDRGPLKCPFADEKAL